MSNSGCSEAEIEEMRSCLTHDGWVEFSLLPEGWRFKKKGIYKLYITRSGDLLKTHKDVLEYLRKEDDYTSKHEEKMYHTKTYFTNIVINKHNKASIFSR